MNKDAVIGFVAIVIMVLAGLAGCAGKVSAVRVATLASPAPSHGYAVTVTSTVGYQATAVSAQMTSDAAMRLQVQATAAQAERDQVNIMLTARADEWTVTAAPTSVAMTATEQVRADALIVNAQNMEMARMTATAAMPTQMVAVAQSKASAEFARLRTFSEVVAMLGFAWFLFAVGLFAFLNSRSGEVANVREVYKVSEVSDVSSTQAMRLASGTVITIRKESGGVVEGWRYVVPCTDEMLTQFAEGVMGGEKSLAIGEWEGRGTLWTRDTYKEMRNFLLSNRFAFSAGGGAIVLNAEGEEFLGGWLNVRTLPHRYEFEHEIDNLPVIIPHTHEVMDMSGGEGEVLLTANND